MNGESPGTEPYKGVRDFYPADWAILEAIFEKAQGVLATFGYEEYNASPLERAELYESKGNEEIVSEQTYTFIDRGERRVTLRPEMTPTLARMVAAKRRELVFPLRWFSIPNVFRYERPQRGRLREHYQLNVDLIGIKDTPADGEIIVLAHTLLTAFGAGNDDFVIRLNSRALLDALCEAAGLKGEAKSAYRRLLDRKTKMPKGEFEGARSALTTTDPLSLIESGKAQEEKEKLDKLIEVFGVRGMTNVVFDPGIVRGFEYYTGIVFEIYDTNPKNPRALFGGGRYDNLIELFGGEPLPAVGFGMGDVTLVDFLSTHKLLPEVTSAPELYIGTPEASDLEYAQIAARALRERGVRVFVNLTSRSLGDQVREADKRGIPYFAAAGKEEQKAEALKVKKLATGEERALPMSKVLEFIR